MPADPDHAMMYGSAVAITADGTRVVVGAWGDGRDEGMGYAGSLYVIDGTTGTLLLKVRPTGIGYDDRFASSVAITPDGTRILAGAVHDDDKGQESGSAYIMDGNTGATLLKVTAADGAQNDHFGGAVAISSDGTRIAVGAPEHDGSRGKGYVFGVDGTTITTLLKVTDDNWVTYFGKSAAMNADGTRVVFGSGSGSVYIVEVATGTMTKVGVGTDRQAVAITPDGSRIAVGNDRDGTLGHLAGGAVVLDGNDGSVLHHLTAADGSPNDRFGYAVAISSDGARVAVSANYDNSGSAYMFDGTDGTQLLKVVGEDSEYYDFFGSALAISSDGTRIVVGAENGGQHSPYTSDRSVGSAYIFQGPEVRQGGRCVSRGSGVPGRSWARRCAAALQPRGRGTPRRPSQDAPQISPQDSPRGSQEGPKIAQESPKTAQERPSTAQEEAPQEGNLNCHLEPFPPGGPRGPQDSPKRPQEAPKMPTERPPKRFRQASPKGTLSTIEPGRGPRNTTYRMGQRSERSDSPPHRVRRVRSPRTVCTTLFPHSSYPRTPHPKIPFLRALVTRPGVLPAGCTFRWSEASGC